MNDMSPTRPAPVVKKLDQNAKILSNIPPEIPWPDLSNERSLKARYPYFGEDGTKAFLIARYERPDDQKPGEIKKVCILTHTG